MKEVTFKISIPRSGLSSGKTFTVKVKDDATFIECLSMVDKYVLEHPEESIFPIYDGYIHYYLQLFWDPEKNEIYDDCGLLPYGPNREFMPIFENPEYNVLPDSKIDIQPDAGC
jgi:hypothetical protein